MPDDRHDSGDCHGTACVDDGSTVVEGEDNLPWDSNPRVVTVDANEIEKLQSDTGFTRTEFLWMPVTIALNGDRLRDRLWGVGVVLLYLGLLSLIGMMVGSLL